MKPIQTEQYPPEESIQRRNETLRRMLNTPPHPHEANPPQVRQNQKKAAPPARKPRTAKKPA
jgi:hypothetical protein